MSDDKACGYREEGTTNWNGMYEPILYTTSVKA